MDNSGLSRPAWRTSTYSNPSGECVEVAHSASAAVAVRDSKDPDGPKLAFAPGQWKAFISTVRA